jgi:hypothetical protein
LQSDLGVNDRACLLFQLCGDGLNSGLRVGESLVFWIIFVLFQVFMPFASSALFECLIASAGISEALIHVTARVGQFLGGMLKMGSEGAKVAGLKKRCELSLAL